MLNIHLDVRTFLHYLFQGKKDFEGRGCSYFNVEVTNTGDVAGKDVVEVYYNPPYTNGGIEKASVNLIQYEKTETLEPGDSPDNCLQHSA